MGFQNSKKQFKCQICSKMFSTSSFLVLHIRTHTDERPYLCTICNMAFHQRPHLNKHQLIHSTIQCKLCRRRFRNDLAYQEHHLSFHTLEGKPILCNVCGTRFIDRGRLDKHMKKHEDWNMTQCIFCLRISRNRSALEVHIRVHTKEAPHFCKSCPSEFQTKFLLSNHHASKHASSARAWKFECYLCPYKTFTNGRLFRHLERHVGEKRFRCEICDKGFITGAELRSHLKLIHTVRSGPVENGEQLSCELCHKLLKNKTSLQHHLRRMHSAKPLKCPTCNKGFMRNSELKAHEKWHRQKNFKCEICNKGFVSKGDVKSHMLVHTVQGKPHKCDICGARFRRKEAVGAHARRLHHLKEMAKFECIFCSRQYATKEEFENHLRSHTHENRYICNLCPNEYKYWGSLKDHLGRCHSHQPRQKRQFPCELCPKLYASKTQLYRHILTHTGERTFNCEICREGFTNAQQVIQHRTAVHGDDIHPHSCKICGKGLPSLSGLKSHIWFCAKLPDQSDHCGA